MLKLAVKLKVELEMGTWRAETETSAVDLIAPHLEGIFQAGHYAQYQPCA